MTAFYLVYVGIAGLSIGFVIGAAVITRYEQKQSYETGWLDRPDVPVVAMDASQMEPPIGMVAPPSDRGRG